MVGDRTVAAVVGDVDLSNLPQLTAALDGLEDPAGVVDLRSVEYFDPVCLGALVSADLRARRRGGTVAVLATGAVRELLAESRLDRALTVITESPDSDRP